MVWPFGCITKLHLMNPVFAKAFRGGTAQTQFTHPGGAAILSVV